MSDKCPLCEAERTHDFPEHQAYACGTRTREGVIAQVGRECLERQRDQLKVIVDKLPKDAEGVPCIPGYERWHPREVRRGVVRFDDWEDPESEKEGVEFCYEFGVSNSKSPTTGEPWAFQPISECYSTREAAEAARESGT